MSVLMLSNIDAGVTDEEIGAFLVKYGFEAAFAVSPSLSAHAGFSAAYLLLTGGFTGIFVGKYARYLASLRMEAGGKGLETAG